MNFLLRGDFNLCNEEFFLSEDVGILASIEIYLALIGIFFASISMGAAVRRTVRTLGFKWLGFSLSRPAVPEVTTKPAAQAAQHAGNPALRMARSLRFRCDSFRLFIHPFREL